LQTVLGFVIAYVAVWYRPGGDCEGEVTVAAEEAASKPRCARPGKGFLDEIDK
jgi:hypothetical protein